MFFLYFFLCQNLQEHFRIKKVCVCDLLQSLSIPLHSLKPWQRSFTRKFIIPHDIDLYNVFILLSSDIILTIEAQKNEMNVCFQFFKQDQHICMSSILSKSKCLLIIRRRNSKSQTMSSLTIDNFFYEFIELTLILSRGTDASSDHSMYKQELEKEHTRY